MSAFTKPSGNKPGILTKVGLAFAGYIAGALSYIALFAL